MVQASPESTPEHKMVPASPETTPEHEMVPASPESPPKQHMAPESPPEQHMAPELPPEQQVAPELPPEQQVAPASPEWAAGQGPWLLMVRIPDVFPDDEFPPGTHLSLLSEHAPHASHIAVSRSIAPDPKDIYNHPYVAAFGDFGRFLLYSTQGTEPQQEAVDDFDIMPEPRLDYTGFPKAYFLCDITTGLANRLPDPDPERPIINHGNVGLLTTPFESMIIEFQPLVGTNRASLLCYSTTSGAWSVHDLLYTPATPARQARWRGGDGVVNLEDRMLFVDLAFGMFSLAIPLPTQHRPEVRYIPLPPGAHLNYSSGHAQTRCIDVSQGMVRFVEIDHSICLWTLIDLDTADWFLECEIPMESLWAEDGFRAMGLPEVTPAVAFVHPEKYHIVYLFMYSVLFSINIKTGRCITGNIFNMYNPPADYHSSRFIRPWRFSS